MSTSVFRMRLGLLETALNALHINSPDIYESYIEMILILNAVPRANMVWVINLIGTLTFQTWNNLPVPQQQPFIKILGQDFIDAFVGNTLITILLQANMPKLILTSAYLYSLLKMLFIVFGYNKLTPTIVNACPGPMTIISNDPTTSSNSAINNMLSSPSLSTTSNNTVMSDIINDPNCLETPTIAYNQSIATNPNFFNNSTVKSATTDAYNASLVIP